MEHRNLLEAIDWTLQDIYENKLLFKNTILLLGKYIRQTLPIIAKGIPAYSINVLLKYFYICEYITVLKLHINITV